MISTYSIEQRKQELQRWKRYEKLSDLIPGCEEMSNEKLLLNLDILIDSLLPLEYQSSAPRYKKKRLPSLIERADATKLEMETQKAVK
jgi:hypothetical protein